MNPCASTSSPSTATCHPTSSPEKATCAAPHCKRKSPQPLTATAIVAVRCQHYRHPIAVDGRPLVGCSRSNQVFAHSAIVLRFIKPTGCHAGRDSDTGPCFADGGHTSHSTSILTAIHHSCGHSMPPAMLLRLGCWYGFSRCTYAGQQTFSLGGQGVAMGLPMLTSELRNLN